MNKKKVILIALLVIALGVFLFWKFYINKATNDFYNEKPSSEFSVNDLLDKSNKDTAALGKLKDQFIAVSGMVKKISRDSDAVTFELGDTTSPSSIILQMDKRHMEECINIKENQTINIKGVLQNYSIDTDDLGMGNTIELNYCCLHKK
jgi:tRNA_anti-like